MKSTRLLVIGHGMAASGFSRVAAGIIKNLPHGYEVHHLAVNHTSRQVKAPWQAYGNPNPDDMHAVARGHELCHAIKPDIVLVSRLLLASHASCCQSCSSGSDVHPPAHPSTCLNHPPIPHAAAPGDAASSAQTFPSSGAAPQSPKAWTAAPSPGPSPSPRMRLVPNSPAGKRLMEMGSQLFEFLGISKK